MSRKLNIRPRADWDLDGLVEYIARRNEDAAERVQDRIEETLRRIEQFPFMGLKLPTRQGLYRVRPVLRFRQFVIIYQITDTTIEVVRIVRGVRDLGRLFR
jgi:toxin ParE1/3/4